MEFVRRTEVLKISNESDYENQVSIFLQRSKEFKIAGKEQPLPKHFCFILIF